MSGDPSKITIVSAASVDELMITEIRLYPQQGVIEIGYTLNNNNDVSVMTGSVSFSSSVYTDYTAVKNAIMGLTDVTTALLADAAAKMGA